MVEKMRPVPDVLKTIKECLGKADKELWQGIESPNDFSLNDDSKQYIEFLLDRAYLQARALLELNGLPRMLSYLEELYGRAKKDFTKIDVFIASAEPYLVWGDELEQVLAAIEANCGEPGSLQVSKDLIEILRNSVYAITAQCFGNPPQNEDEVHTRIEAVLRCVFPDLLEEVTITKPIKNFKPDTGIPSLNTLIEYKFVPSKEDAKRIADEVLADTRGYTCREWKRFLYVVYETSRIKTESEWNQLMRESEIPDNTTAIVLQGVRRTGVNKNQAAAR